MTDAASRPALLIVDNDKDTRRLYADILLSTGMHVLEAANPYEAFDQLRRRSVALIVTDIGMPGGGLEYLADLRDKAPTCPIIAMSGLGGARVHTDAMAAGATEFLEKPIRSKQLRDTIARLLPSCSK